MFFHPSCPKIPNIASNSPVYSNILNTAGKDTIFLSVLFCLNG